MRRRSTPVITSIRRSRAGAEASLVSSLRSTLWSKRCLLMAWHHARRARRTERGGRTPLTIDRCAGYPSIAGWKIRRTTGHTCFAMAALATQLRARAATPLSTGRAIFDESNTVEPPKRIRSHHAAASCRSCAPRRIRSRSRRYGRGRAFRSTTTDFAGPLSGMLIA